LRSAGIGRTRSHVSRCGRAAACPFTSSRGEVPLSRTAHRRARERLKRHDIAITDCEAGDEGEIDGVADRPALDKANQHGSAASGLTRSSTTATAMVRRDAPGVRVLTRKGQDWTWRFPTILQATARLNERS